MQIQQPLDAAIQKEIAAKGGTIEFCLYNPRSKIGVRAWELKIKMPDGKLKIAIVRDYDFEMSMEEIQIKHFKNRAERNAEICRLYHESAIKNSQLVYFAGCEFCCIFCNAYIIVIYYNFPFYFSSFNISGKGSNVRLKMPLM